MKTKTITTPYGTYEVETKIHHLDKTYAECEVDCPKGWEMATYEVLQWLRNSEHRNKFNLLNTWEFVQQPDKINKEKGFVAWFCAGSVRSDLGCCRDASNRLGALGVRYMRKVK